MTNKEAVAVSGKVGERERLLRLIVGQYEYGIDGENLDLTAGQRDSAEAVLDALQARAALQPGADAEGWRDPMAKSAPPEAKPTAQEKE